LPGLCSLTVAEVARLLESKKTSPEELAKSCLSRIHELDGLLNAFVFVDEKQALRDAKSAEEQIRNGNYRGPLHGIPVGHKDIFYTKTMPTAAGSKILKGFIPSFDSTVVALLRRAGAITIGKTNTHEFANGLTTDSPWFGPTHNPWDVARVPGGSSGGSAAAIAADMCMAATGTDSGGSVRVPASCCGVVGLKPTYGRCSTYGVIPLSWSLDHSGCIAKCVQDAALMLQALAGKDEEDPTSRDVPVSDYSANLRAGVKDLRAAVPRNFFFEAIDPEVEGAVRQAIVQLEKLGMRLVEVTVPLLDQVEAVKYAILLSEAATYHERNLAERPEQFSAPTRRNLEVGSCISAVDYLQAQRVRRLLKQRFEQVFQKAEVLITPTMPITATAIGQQLVDVADREEPVPIALSRYTSVFNLTGFPAISLPCGFSRSGLPIGMQLIGAEFDEATVLTAAYAYEQATEWHKRKPALERE
jgi:aspartyl-tRNA(Asn)/glutamyl-tRNA(Gln) amidotransferase subunit A